jgi:hypothetical protein
MKGFWIDSALRCSLLESDKSGVTSNPALTPSVPLSQVGEGEARKTFVFTFLPFSDKKNFHFPLLVGEGQGEVGEGAGG